MFNQNESASFRHRGFVCQPGGQVIQVFGTSDPAPQLTDASIPDGTTAIVESWDHLVQTTTTITNYVAPATDAALP